MPLASTISAIGNLWANHKTNQANLKAVRETNQANMEIAQMNNEWNAKMMEKQMAYNTDMWNKENEYNTAANQAKRFKEAGLNPALMMGSANAGSAGSVGGVTPPTAEPVTMQAPTFDYRGAFSGFQDLANYLLAKREKEAGIKLMQIDAETRAMRNLAELNKTRAETDSTRAKTEIDKIQSRWVERLNQSTYDNARADYQNKLEDKKLKVQQGLLNQKELSYFDQRAKAEIANTVADTMLKYAQRFQATTQGRLNEKEAKKVIAETSKVVQEELKLKAEELGQHINNEILAKSAYSLVKKAYKDAFSPGGVVGSVWNLAHHAAETINPTY